MDLIGSMYHRGVIKTNNPAQKGAGNKDVYTDALSIRCSLKKSSGNRGVSFSDIVGDNSYTSITRSSEALNSLLKMSMKLEIDGVLYTVQSWELMNDDRKNYIKFSLTTETNG